MKLIKRAIAKYNSLPYGKQMAIGVCVLETIVAIVIVVAIRLTQGHF